MNRLYLLKSFVLRDLAGNWVRTLLTVTGIGLGVAVMLAINLANGTALNRFEESINLVAGKSNLEIRSVAEPDLDESVLARLLPLQDKNVVYTPVIDQMAVVPGATPDVVQVLGVDMFADPAFRPFSYQQMKESDSRTDTTAIFNRNTVYVGERFALRHDLKVGASFDLLVNERKKPFKVVGIISYSGPGKTFGGDLLLMDIGPAQEAFAMRGRVSRIELIVPAETRNAVMQQLQAVVAPGTMVELPSRRGKQVEKMLSAFQYNLAALSLIALLVGMFVIYNTMSITVIRKRTEIGILRTLGVSRRRIFAIFFAQAFLLGVVGSILGLLAGTAFAHFAVHAVARTVQALYVDQPAAEISLNGQAVAMAFGFGLCMTILAAAGPVFEAMAVPPAEAARRASLERRVQRGAWHLCVVGLLLGLLAAGSACLPAIDGFPFFGYLAAALTIFAVALCLPLVLAVISSWIKPILISLFGSEGKLAILTLMSTPGRMAVTVASLMLGIAMMVSLAIMIGSFRQTVIVWVNQSLKADIYVAPLSRATSSRAGRLTGDTIDRLKRVPGVQDVDAFVEFPIEYKGDASNLGAADLDVLNRHGSLMFVGASDSHQILSSLEHDNACIVSESFAVHNNISRGDTITLQSANGPWAARVNGIFYDYASDRGYILLPRWLYRQHYRDTYSSTAGVYLKPGADIDAVRTKLVSLLGADTGLSIRSNRDLRKEVLRVFDNTFAITYALHSIAIAVAILGVMNALFAITFEMRREFAILSYLGASKRQLQKIILIQAGTLGLFGNVLGVGVGFVLSLLLIHVINKQSFGWTVQLSLPYEFLLESFVLVLISSILSGWLPARAATGNLSPEVVRVE